MLLSSMASLVSSSGLDAVVALIHSLVTLVNLRRAREGRKNGGSSRTNRSWSGAEWRAVGDPLPPPSLPAALVAAAGLIRRLMMRRSGGGALRRGVSVVVPPLGVLQLQGRRVKRDPTNNKNSIRSAFSVSCVLSSLLI
jgi:hypothetical protein